MSFKFFCDGCSAELYNTGDVHNTHITDNKYHKAFHLCKKCYQVWLIGANPTLWTDKRKPAAVEPVRKTTSKKRK